MDITLTYRDTDCIPVSDVELDPATWARERARRFRTVAELDAAAGARVAGALEDIAVLDSTDHRAFLLVSPGARVLAPFVIFASDGPLQRAEQAEFLWNGRALLPATSSLVETAELGDGFSVTTAERHENGDFGFRRWLFLGTTRSVGMVLGPVAPYGLVAVEKIAEEMVSSVRVAGYTSAADRERLDELDGAVSRLAESWPA